MSEDGQSSSRSLADAYVQRHLARTRQLRQDYDRLANLEPEVASVAIKTFGSVDGAVSWLTDGAFGLAGRVPLEVAATPEGAKEVVLLMHRIEYNIAI